MLLYRGSGNNMPFKISIHDINPAFESLPVVKITNYPLEKREYKPYAQARFCFVCGDFKMQLLAFETTPDPQSRLICSFNFNPIQNKLFMVDITNYNEYNFTVIDNGVEHKFPIDNNAFSIIHGEDLQGIYWGANICIKKELIFEIFEVCVSKNMNLKGNFFKVCTSNTCSHYGCLYPTDFFDSNPFGNAFLGDFTTVKY